MNIKGFRTVAFNIIAAIAPFILMPAVKDALPHQWGPYYMVLVGAINIILRWKTDTPIFKKDNNVSN